MRLNDIEFGNVWCASGARNFTGEGWPYHRWLGPFAPDFRGSTFVAKTTTLGPRVGNMPLDDEDWARPTERFPKCIKVNWRKGAVLNAVGLSGPGLMTILQSRRWQSRLDPFVISLASVAGDRGVRVQEFGQMAELLKDYRTGFSAPFAVELNLSCPNAGKAGDPLDVAWEATEALRTMAWRLPGVPLVAKVNLFWTRTAVEVLVTSPHLAAISVSNTLPWGSSYAIDWEGLFGPVSPLFHLGGGGLSGRPLLPLVEEWVSDRRNTGIKVPIIAGGGVLSKLDALRLLDDGADAISLGVVAILRPWRVRSIINFVNEYKGEPQATRIKGTHDCPTS